MNNRPRASHLPKNNGASVHCDAVGHELRPSRRAPGASKPSDRPVATGSQRQRAETNGVPISTKTHRTFYEQGRLVAATTPCCSALV